MDHVPSELKPGDFVKYRHHEDSGHGYVTEVYQNGCFIKPTTAAGVRRMARIGWFSDDATLIEEINGESLF